MLPVPGAHHFAYPIVQPFSAEIYYMEANSKQLYLKSSKMVATCIVW